jgi:hypothetical protein
MAQQILVGQDVLIIEAPRSHSHTSHSSGRVISPSQRSLLNNMQHSQETDIHAHGGIRTCSPNKWTAADARRKHLVLKCTPKLNTECEFTFVAHCTWDVRLSQRCLWGLRSITDCDNLPMIRRDLLLLSSGGIGSGRWGSFFRNLNTYLQNSMVSHSGNMFRWMACASTVLRTGQKVNVNLYHVVKAWRGGRVVVLTTMTSDLEAAGWSTPRSDRFTPPGKTPFPFYRRMGGVRVRKISPTPAFEPRTVQPVAGRYREYGKPFARRNSNVV